MRVIKNLDVSGFQLQNEIVSDCRKLLQAGEERRKKLRTLIEWKELRAGYLRVIKNPFPETIFSREKPLKARLISKYRFKHFRIENIIFESLSGWAC